jgi:hypothetical protein
MLQACHPDTTRSLPNHNLKPSHKYYREKAPINYTRVGSFKKQFHSFLEVPPRGFDGVTLAGDIQFRANAYVAVAFTFDYGS